MGVKVYGPPMSTCTARVISTLEEMGADYEVVPIDFAAGEHKQPAHLARNVLPFARLFLLLFFLLVVFNMIVVR